MVFDDYMRQHFIMKCHKFGIEVESEAIYGGRQYLEKQDYIIQKQQEKIAEKEQENQGAGRKDFRFRNIDSGSF